MVRKREPKNILGSVPLGRQENTLAGTDPVAMNLDAEWTQIQKMIQAGIIPSIQRLKEYLQVCWQKPDFNQEVERVLAAIADILRLEEERVLPTDPNLKELLTLLESDNTAQDLQLALSRITISPKEPKLIEP